MSTRIRLAIGVGTATGSGTITVLFVLLGVPELLGLLGTGVSDARSAGGAQIDEVITVTAAALGALLAGWYALSALVGVICLIARGLGGAWAAGERAVRRTGAPGIARLVGAGTGAVLAAGLLAGPAHAAAAPTAAEPATQTVVAAVDHATAPDDLSWGAEPNDSEAGGTSDAGTDEAEPAETGSPAGREAPADESALPVSTTATAEDAATYQVRPGDSLWSIAAAHLPGDPSAAEIAESWPRWYAANAATVGADPDRIHPGMHLHAPVPEEEHR